MNMGNLYCLDNEIERRSNNIHCGISNFDNSPAKLELGHFIVITGKPNMGKTAFSITAMCNMAINNRIPVAMFSLEMCNEHVVRRIIMNTLKVRFPLEQTNETELKELTTQIFNKLSDVPIYLDDTAGATIDEIIDKIQELKRDKDVKVFFIDYINLMSDFLEKKLEILRRLKDTASRLHICIVANCCLSKGQDITISSNGKSAEASFITDVLTEDCFEIANKVCLLHRPGFYNHNLPKDLADIYIWDKDGKYIDTLHLIFHPEYAQFLERTMKP